MTTTGRRRLIPLWVPMAAGAVVLAVVVIVVVAALRQTSSRVSVPNVVGLDVATARSRLGQAGLSLVKGDQRYSSTLALDGVLEQAPGPGALVPAGSAVSVVLSAGSEAFPMPDVTGMPLASGRRLLQDKGLVVETDVVASDRPKNQVLSTNPAPGATVRTSGTVRLSVSSGGKGVSAVQPVDLTGHTFVIDPVPVSAGVTDTPMEVERRLRSLLEASGARVVVTRSITESIAPDALRGIRAVEASADAVVGLSLGSGPSGGFVAATLPSSKTVPRVYLGSLPLVAALQASLSAIDGIAQTAETPNDAVLLAARAPGVRLSLGSIDVQHDRDQFTDPAWADSVAAAIYSAIGKVYAPKTP